MGVNMYLVGIVLGLLIGTYMDWGLRKKYIDQKSGKRIWKVSREGWMTIKIGPLNINFSFVLILLMVMFILDLTYAKYIGSVRVIIWYILAALIVGSFVRMSLADEFRWRKPAIAMIIVLFLLTSTMARYVTPDNLEDNDLYKGIGENRITDENPNYLTDPQEIRVVSWQLGTDYLQRAYKDAASYMSTSEDQLLKYTDPSYYNGSFIWVNAPTFETIKWTGEKKIPFFVYITNDPANMSSGDTASVTHKVEIELSVHKTKITWENRLEQIAFGRYAGKYEIAQIRFDMDDDEKPFWIMYLARRDTVYSMLYLEKILIVDATDMDNNWEYDIKSEDIPQWLEVIYPDEYVYSWVRFWGSHRMGLGYSLFNKAHLYDPDDDSARFIVVNGKTYWHIPMVQKNSHVLGGYVWVDTRTGDPTFFDREDKSMVDMDTVKEQIKKYLASGAIGFQQLDIHEGYLYPFLMDDGHVREAYVFPLYAGLTIAKYAIVDAEHYTEEPSIDEDLPTTMDDYRSRVKTPIPVTDLFWQEFTIESVWSNPMQERSIVMVSNDTDYNLSIVTSKHSLDAGLIKNIAVLEWEEFNLAISRWNHGDDVVIWMVVEFDQGPYDGFALDIDWEESSLIER